MKSKYINYAKDNFKGKAKDLVLKQMELFYSDNKVDIKNKYNIGDDVFLKKGTFLHGIGGNPDAFDWIIENGFIGNDFNTTFNKNKIFHSIGMWNIKEDMLLKDYINFYSGATIRYLLGRGPDEEERFLIAPFGKVEETFIKLNNDSKVWRWEAEQTKEIRFMPSLASDKTQIAFILNMESEYAKKLAYADVFNEEFKEDVLKYFCVEHFMNKLLNNEINPITTDRESAIMFGIPSTLIEGILVGRKFERDQERLDYIKKRLPDCYICNLDGKVIVSNK